MENNTRICDIFSAVPERVLDIVPANTVPTPMSNLLGRLGLRKGSYWWREHFGKTKNVLVQDSSAIFTQYDFVENRREEQ